MMRSYCLCLFRRNEKYFNEIFRFLFQSLLDNDKIVCLQVDKNYFFWFFSIEFHIFILGDGNINNNNQKKRNYFKSRSQFI